MGCYTEVCLSARKSSQTSASTQTVIVETYRELSGRHMAFLSFINCVEHTDNQRID